MRMLVNHFNFNDGQKIIMSNTFSKSVDEGNDN